MEAMIAYKRFTPNTISELSKCEIFVFGSNLMGQHAGGAARTAYRKFGAKWGVGVGPTGQSYAIPTMHGGLDVIQPYVDQFIEYAKTHPMNRFLVTRVGCGIAGFKDDEMAPMFAAASHLPNVSLPENWWQYIELYESFIDRDVPETISDDVLKMLSKRHLYEIGAEVDEFIPDIHIRYVCDNNSFGYTTLNNCFFYFDGGMYIWEKDKKWAEDHNQDVVEDVFQDECRDRGYAHRVIAAGVSTGHKDSRGEYMYTGDVIEIAKDGQTTILALSALRDGYGFRLGDTELLLADCRKKHLTLTRVGTVFYQLDRKEFPTPVAARVMDFNNIADGQERHQEKLLMSKYTPNFDQDFWEYQGLEMLGAEYHWNN
jgi:hypothetical protein